MVINNLYQNIIQITQSYQFFILETNFSKNIPLETQETSKYVCSIHYIVSHTQQKEGSADRIWAQFVLFWSLTIGN